MRLDETSDLWWKNAVVYCLDIETFLDSDGDGIGDVRGLISQIDYLAGLGVTCLWLMPFYPTPNRDDGYDVSDYYGVDERLGTLGDFVELVHTATDRGLRVVVDLVVNHTSDEHPWFQAARSDPGSPLRDFYVWRDEPSDEPKGIAFPDRETSNWAYDEQAGQYYLHRFYSFQPDLNVANPAVRDEIARIMGFWLALGVSGFRMDAVPFLLETSGLVEEVHGDPQAWLRRLRAFGGRRRGDSMLLGEVNSELKDLAKYFGDEDGDELTMQFAFLLNQSLWLSLARGEAEPLENVIRSLPVVPPENAWAVFLRNHDELTLDKLTAAQRQEVFAAFGPMPTCSSTDTACDAAWRQCWAATATACAWRGASCSPCPEHRCCSTATRSASVTTSRSPTASACAFRCSGRTSPTAASRPPKPTTSCGRWRPVAMGRVTSTWPSSDAIPTRS